jgi:Tfp pilus assembly protein PilX
MNPKQKPIRAHREAGIVLVVALIMLVVIGLASVAVMRTALNTDVISDNNRVHAQAMQAAQAGLQYCEAQISAKALIPTAAATTGGEAWQTFANWVKDPTTSATDPSAAKQVPATFVTSSDVNAATRRTGRELPRCMAQYRTVTGSTNNIVVITARGFSDNYAQDTVGHTQAGAVVWLQSIIQL